MPFGKAPRLWCTGRWAPSWCLGPREMMDVYTVEVWEVRAVDRWEGQKAD